MRGKLTAAIIAVIAGWTASGLPARAIMICDCCVGKAPPACQSACQKATKEFCQPQIVLKGRRRGNPLNGVNLKYLDLSGLTPAQLEKVRKWAEKARRKAERRFRKARLRIRRRHKGKSAFAPAQARRDAAIVNYQHIMRAYRQAMHEARRKD